MNSFCLEELCSSDCPHFPEYLVFKQQNAFEMVLITNEWH